MSIKTSLTGLALLFGGASAPAPAFALDGEKLPNRSSRVLEDSPSPVVRGEFILDFGQGVPRILGRGWTEAKEETRQPQLYKMHDDTIVLFCRVRDPRIEKAMSSLSKLAKAEKCELIVVTPDTPQSAAAWIQRRNLSVAVMSGSKSASDFGIKRRVPQAIRIRSGQLEPMEVAVENPEGGSTDDEIAGAHESRVAAIGRVLQGQRDLHAAFQSLADAGASLSPSTLQDIDELYFGPPGISTSEFRVHRSQGRLAVSILLEQTMTACRNNPDIWPASNQEAWSDLKNLLSQYIQDASYDETPGTVRRHLWNAAAAAFTPEDTEMVEYMRSIISEKQESSPDEAAWAKECLKAILAK